jgi:hypothetical protein
MIIDIKRLNPYRIFSGIKRRLRELPHSYTWHYSKQGNSNKEELLAFKNKHQGEILYLLANGPSINKTNLELLKGKRIMCMNRFYIKFKDLSFKPDYLVCMEETVLDQFYSDFDKLDIPFFINWRSRSKIKNAVYLKESFSLNPFFQEDLTRPTNSGGTVTYMCLQLAYFMGFKKIVIVGMDHFFKETGVATRAEIRTYERDESHFDPNYFPKGIKWLLPDLEKSEFSYRIANSHYVGKGRSIVDSTVDGKCNIFKKGILEDHITGK